MENIKELLVGLILGIIGPSLGGFLVYVCLL